MLLMDYARAGTLVGKDAFGNEYYEDKQDVTSMYSETLDDLASGCVSEQVASNGLALFWN